ncbi:MAG: GtrA family protein [Clostridia bacterium]|nr:GtrA family protein [Clostridia bacterium]
MGKIKDFIKKLYYDKRVRFLFVGVLNTIVGVGITNLVYLCFGINIFAKEEIPLVPMIAGTLSGQIIGTIHSYFWNKYFTFRVKEKSGAEFLRFVIVYVIQYGVSLGLTALFNVWIAIPALVTVLTVLICTILSYLGHNFFSFKNNGKYAVNDKEKKDV